jgi:hypothetical protein
MRRELAAGFFLTFVASLAQAQSQFEFKGVPLGASEQIFTTAHPHGACIVPGGPSGKTLGDRICTMRSASCASAKLSAEVCAEMLSYSGVPVETISASFYEDKLSSVFITFKRDQYERVTTALAGTLGSGAAKDEPFTTRDGQNVVNSLHEWRRGASSIRARKYTSSPDYSAMYIQLDSHMAEFQRRRQQKPAP